MTSPASALPEAGPLPALDAARDLPGRPCSIASTLTVIGDRWALLALREVFFGNRRFNEIARNTGAPRDRLAARLKALVDAGVLERREYQSAPPRSEYFLTAAGKDLGPVLRAMVTWGDKWMSDSPPGMLIHRPAGHEEHELVSDEHCATCGERVVGREVTIRSERPGWTTKGPVA
jgi:DNA-binding HxlR family transcriptional regulator